MKHNANSLSGFIRHNNFIHFITDSLNRKRFQTIFILDTSFQSFFIYFTFAENSIKPEESHDTQIIFLDSLAWISNEANHTVFKVINTVIIIKDIAFFISIYGIDGQIAA